MSKMDKALMARATSSDDAPTPGYMYGEISKMSLISFDACKEIEDYLIARLKKNNHNIKHKCLVIIKHVCRTGRPDFKRDMVRQAELIRECLSFRGPPDPLRGDQIYKRVHEAANEALAAIYDSEASTSVAPSSVSSRIQGFGSDPNPVPVAPPATASGSLSTITDIATSVVGAVTGKLGSGTSGGILSGHGYPTGGSYGPGAGPGAPMVPYGPPSTSAVGVSVSPTPGWSGGGAGGGSSGMGGGGGGGGGGSRYGGMGNPNFQDPRNEKSFLEKASTLVKAQIGSVVNTVSSSSNTAPQRVTYAQPPDYNFATNRGPTANQWQSSAAPNTSLPAPPPPAPPVPPPPSSEGATSSYHQARTQQAFQWSQQAPGTRTSGGVGGVWGNASQPAVAEPPVNGGNAMPPTEPSQQSAPRPLQQAGRVGGAASDGEYEKRLVLELCAPGGTRAVPPKDKLDDFLSSVRTLNIDVVGGIILDQLGEEAWQVRSKALHVVEALTRLSGNEEWRHFFIDNAGELEAVTSDNKAVVRDKAVRILHSLGINTATPTQTQAQAETGAVSPARDLLDMGGDDGEAETGGWGQAQQGADILGSTDLVASPQRPMMEAPGAPFDLFTGTNAAHPPPAQAMPAAPAQQASSSGGLDMFADLAVKAHPSPSRAPPPQEAAPTFSQLAPTAHQPSAVTTAPADQGSADLLMIDTPQLIQNVSPMNAFDPLAGRRAAAPPQPQSQPQHQPPPQAAMLSSDLAALSLGPGGYRQYNGRPGMGGPPPPHPQSFAMSNGPLTPGVAPTNLGIMGQGMIPALQPRTIIPSAEEEGQGASAFSFISGAQGGKGGGGGRPGSGRAGGPAPVNEDAFSFVKDAMRTS